MSDYEVILSILDRAHPDPKTRHYYTEEGVNYKGAGYKAIVFPQDDEWYNSTLIFSTDGKLLSVD